MSEFVKKHLIKIIVGGSLILIGLLNYTGFCFSKFKYLSDDEKIRIAVAAANSKVFLDIYFNFDEPIKSSLEGDVPFYQSTDKIRRYNENLKRDDKYRKTISYESVDAFLKENPNCCTAYKRGFSGDMVKSEPTIWARITGEFNQIIRVDFNYRYLQGIIDKEGFEEVGQRHESPKVFYFATGNCGQQYCDED